MRSWGSKHDKINPVSFPSNSSTCVLMDWYQSALEGKNEKEVCFVVCLFVCLFVCFVYFFLFYIRYNLNIYLLTLFKGIVRHQSFLHCHHKSGNRESCFSKLDLSHKIVINGGIKLFLGGEGEGRKEKRKGRGEEKKKKEKKLEVFSTFPQALPIVFSYPHPTAPSHSPLRPLPTIHS